MLIFFYIALLVSAVRSYTPAPRWGQATSLISSYLFIQGGKQSLDNSQSYTGASASEDLLLLPLSNPFSVDSPPWDLISDSTNSSDSQGPAVAWHTLSAFNSSMLLVFGGVPNSVVPLPTQSDSGWLLLVYNRLIPQFTQEPSGWDNEPMRRIHHAAVSSTAGEVYIFGGERADDSQLLFSDPYVFSPDASSFTALPTDNGPPALTGHAAVILSNSQILVFGGLAASGLLSFNSFWTFDISSNSWSSQTVSSASVPQGRRAFAYVLLDDNTVLIHGGCSGDFQQTYSDGWIYNIASGTWTSVPALDAVGQRKDHFAVTYGGQVIFGFGYGQNGPANSSLVIFDPSTGAFPTTFVPPSPTSSVTRTIPVASATASATASTHQVSGTASSVHPTGTNSVGGGGGGGGGKPEGVAKKTTSIALGVVLGFLALVAAGLGAVWYLRRQQRHRWERGGVGGVFSPLGRGDSHGSLPSAARMVGAAPEKGAVESVGATLGSWATWAATAVGLGGVMGARSVAVERDRKQRRDMLADEDTHDIRYGWYDASDTRSSRFGRLRRQGSGGSTWSLMSVFRPKPRREVSGASFGSRAGSLLGHSDAPSEKDPFRDDVEAVVRPGPSRRQSSYVSVASAASGYIDPFADPISERDIAGPGALLVGNYAHGVPLSPVTEASGASASQSGSSAETHTPVLSPFESMSRASTFGVSSSSHALPIGASSPAGSSTRPRASSILDMQPREPEQPMRRSDTWWARFASKSLLDRRSSRGGGAPAPQRTMDFRDPNPLPQRLGFVKEETPSVLAEHRSSNGTERRGSGSSPGHGVARVAAHGKSMSSIQTQQTADSEALERMGDVDVVLRGHRHGGSTSTRGSEITGGGSTDEGHGRSWRPLESADEPVYTSPVEMVPASSFNLPTPPSRTRSLSPSVRPPLSTASSSGSSVAERIRAYERRMSQDVGAPPPPPPPPPSTNADVQERVRKKTHVHGVNYGLVPRASLFVANPGGRDASGDTA